MNVTLRRVITALVTGVMIYRIASFAVLTTTPVIDGTQVYIDYDVYKHAAERFMDNPMSLYDYEKLDPHDGQTYNYPPGSILFFLPLLLVDSDVGGPLVFLIICLSYFVSIAISLRLFARLTTKKSTTFTSVYVCVTALSCTALWETLRFLQVNTITLLLALLAIQFFINKKYFWSGVALFFAVSLKLYPLVILAPFVTFLLSQPLMRTKLWQLSAGFVGSLLATLIVIPFNLYTFYFATFLPELSSLTTISNYNVSIASTVSKLLNWESFIASGNGMIGTITAPLLAKIATFSAIIATTFWWFCSFRKHGQTQPHNNVILWSLLLLGVTTITSPLAWEHFMVLSVPLLIVVVVYEIQKDRALSLPTAVTAFFFTMPRIVNDKAAALIENDLGVLLLAYSSRFLIAIPLLLYLVHKQLIAHSNLK